MNELVLYATIRHCTRPGTTWANEMNLLTCMMSVCSRYKDAQLNGVLDHDTAL